VTLRGNHRQDIFRQPADRDRLDDIVQHALVRSGARLHAFVWMTNHIHLLVQVGDRPLGDLMQRIGTRFARAMQKRTRTTGHLFERRYYALLVDVDSYFLELLRYIHLNPVRAKMVSSPEQYPWSSHHDYLCSQPRGWVTTGLGLRMFSEDAGRARDLYVAFVLDDIDAPSNPSLYRGHDKEPRVLGDDRFLAKLNLSLPHRDPCVTLEQICMDVCREFDVTLEALRSVSRKRSLATARGAIAARAVDGRIATLSDVARFLHRSVAALSRSAERNRFR
jgi:REP element-mobilizing transposase RayT